MGDLIEFLQNQVNVKSRIELQLYRAALLSTLANEPRHESHRLCTRVLNRKVWTMHITSFLSNQVVSVPVTVQSAGASNYYSPGESPEKALLDPDELSAWHTTNTTGWLMAVLPFPIVLSEIEVIRAEGWNAYYNGRNPKSIEIYASPEGSQERSHEVVKMRKCPLDWEDGPEDALTVQIPLNHGTSVPFSRYRFSFENQYPICNTPPGHQHAYNGNKLSLKGLKLYAAAIKTGDTSDEHNWQAIEFINAIVLR